MEKDRVFSEEQNHIKPFEFNHQVAQVFDDMLSRSVPLYRESVLRQAQMVSMYYQPGSRIYDLGCSHGNLGMAVAKIMGTRPFEMIAVDSSIPMIEKFAVRLEREHSAAGIRLVCSGMESVGIEKASVVLMNLTLQFLRPQMRNAMIRKIYDGLAPGGVLLLTEKLNHEQKEIDQLYQAFYRTYKLENGYSELEISQKRDALEKVLIPDTLAIHTKRLQDAGFSKIDVWLKWFNFASMIAVK